MLPIPNLTPYLLISNLLVAGLWAIDHQYQKVRYLQLQNDYQQLVINAEIQANETEAKWRNKIEASQNAAIEREKRLQDSAAAAAAANDGLRDTIKALRSSLPTNSSDANRAYAETLAIVFGECVERYTAMGRNASTHANEAATLSDAWPKD